ncbi:hypothetical protein EYF80_005839 [Liparis tanakae]|uniref:Uncharacterized protein n=1 Tax=Liparis tanakae TaxID=230148 RepID=A0A4Z2J2M2_9TELE|nr:hypothetical protein EYF80_005839 [Liparis tanakae]
MSVNVDGDTDEDVGLPLVSTAPHGDDHTLKYPAVAVLTRQRAAIGPMRSPSGFLQKFNSRPLVAVGVHLTGTVEVGYLQSRDREQRVAQSSRFRPGNNSTRGESEFQGVGTSSLPSERWKSFRGLR